jgi:hypothetical protein
MTEYLYMADTDSDGPYPPTRVPVQAYAGYVQTSFRSLCSAFYPHAHLFSITQQADRVAECLDVENGDATFTEIRPWYDWMVREHVYRPCFYASLSNMPQVMRELAGVPRENYRLWVAAWSSDAVTHLLEAYDAHQYYGTMTGEYDYSILRPDFFKPPPVKPPHHRVVGVPKKTDPTTGILRGPVLPPRPAPKPARKATDVHPKVAAATLAAAIATAVQAVLTAHGVHAHLTTAEIGAITTAAGALAGYVKRSD